MNGPFTASPGTSAVYRATLQALAENGPRRTGITQIARAADTNRPYLYRNWRDAQSLVRQATLHELKRVLTVACDVRDPAPSPHCLTVQSVVRAARLAREHPVVRTMARTEPALVHSAVLRPTTSWHSMVWHWLTEHVTYHLPRGDAQDAATLLVLTVALPYALTPPTEGTDEAAERTATNVRLASALHAVLGLPTPCPDCTPPPAGHPHRPTAVTAHPQDTDSFRGSTPSPSSR
ncbi:TetR/AcrR family transcriptional regulator [Streptomyces sp. NPDC102360]|uniref:TetR/AcrR family transcriptional regulator n=1 Tax=Streptomyces sp. NPDC102360 TaxID=3366160 RepID=UPI0037F5AD22